VPLTLRQAAFLSILAKYDRLPRLEDFFLMWVKAWIRDTLMDPETALEMGITLTDWPDLLQQIEPESRFYILEYWSGRHPLHQQNAGRHLTEGLEGNSPL